MKPVNKNLEFTQQLKMVLVLFSLITVIGAIRPEDCIARDYGNEGTVCVCNAQHCDIIAPIIQPQSHQYITYTTSKNGLRFKKNTEEFMNGAHTKEAIFVNRNLKYQTIIGWGGAFTDSTGININSLSDIVKQKLLESYFGENGLEYNLCRVPIGGSDFSVRAYSYNDGKVDLNLTNFRLEPEDYEHKIPLIKLARRLQENNLKLFASAWTAPKWMKTNNDYRRGYLFDSMYQTWADYFVKFLDLYKKEGVQFWAITTGNEPSLALFPIIEISTVGWTYLQMQKFIAKNLGPTLENSEYSDIKLLAIDDTKIHVPWLVDLIFENEKARNYVDGIATHWYLGNHYPNLLLTETHDKYPDKFILQTEACNGYITNDVLLGSWERGEAYAEDIIDHLNHWTTGWVDWNMVLDTNGGPNYVNNFVDAPIITNASANEFYKQPMYYALGHFSKFIPEGSVRIALEGTSNGLDVVALERPDGGIAIVVLNQNEETIPLYICDNKTGNIRTDVIGKSITTILYW